MHAHTETRFYAARHQAGGGGGAGHGRGCIDRSSCGGLGGARILGGKWRETLYISVEGGGGEEGGGGSGRIEEMNGSRVG
jgi:hypothetical protein